jgi:hypothetical protein
VRRVSYQSMLEGVPSGPTSVYVSLGPSAISTRRKDADREASAALSKPQARWLKDVEEISGRGIDGPAVMRALVDLGMELEIDWAMLAGGKALRAAVREAVLVRRAAPAPEAEGR